MEDIKDEKKVKLNINGKDVEVNKGATLLEACIKAGEKIPTLCYIKGLSPSGACRMCVVEVEGKPNLIPSCSYPTEDNMKVYTRSPKVLNARRTIIELLLASHPFDCLTCQRNQNCELQSLAAEYGIENVPYFGKTRHHYTDFSSPAIIRDPDKCILCGRCVRICEEIQGVSAIDFTGRGFSTMVLPAMDMELSQTNCVNCGQCVLACPTGAIGEVSALGEVVNTLQEGKKYFVAQVAPAIRVSLGEFFGLDPGRNVTGIIASALRKIGFNRVFDTDFSADLTIMEEAKELVDRIKTGKNLPLFTSCCPAWIKFAEHEYPELLQNISSCKSPQQMMGAMVKTYLAEQLKINPEDIYHVSIMPCTAKKFEIVRPEMGRANVQDVDAVLTTREFARLINIFGINFNELEPEDFDSPLGLTSGSGDIFAASGGVAESALRTAHFYITGRDLEKVEFEQVRGFEGLKEAEVEIDGNKIKIAVVNRLSNARKVINAIKKGEKDYHFVEVMACPGGCAGGGGQIYGFEHDRIIERMKSIYQLDVTRKVRLSYNSPAIKEIYDNYLIKPGSQKAHHLLHTSYRARPKRP